MQMPSLLGFWQIESCGLSDCPSILDRSWPVRLVVIVLLVAFVYVLIRFSVNYVQCSWIIHHARGMGRDVSHIQGRPVEGLMAIASRNSRRSVGTVFAGAVSALVSAPPDFTRSEVIQAVNRAFLRNQRTLVLKLSPGVGVLQSIGSTAPYLGLAGACLGMLDGLSRPIGMEKHAAEAMIMSGVAEALVTTALGIIVAIPALWSHNSLGRRIYAVESELSRLDFQLTSVLKNAELGRAEIGNVVGHGVLSSLGRASSLSLSRRFAQLPHFSIMAAPVFAVILAASSVLQSGKEPQGLIVSLFRERASSGRINIRVSRNTNGSLTVRVNGDHLTLQELDETLQRQLNASANRTAYFRADEDLTWQQVTDALDVVQGAGFHTVLLSK